MGSPFRDILTPSPSPVRNGERVLLDPPAVIQKRKRSSSYDCSVDVPSRRTYLPFLDCASLQNGSEGARDDDKSPNQAIDQLPKLNLRPRKKRVKSSCLMPCPQDSPRDIISLLPRRRRFNSVPSRTDVSQSDRSTHKADTRPKPSKDEPKLHEAFSSISIGRTMHSTQRRPSLTMSRSLSLQFNLSLRNLSSTPANSGGSVPAEGHSESKRDGFSNRRSPVSTTLDYLTASIRFPDVSIGLSI